MKRFILFLSALVTSVLLNARAFAFIWPDFTPVIPCAPQFCAQCIAADIPLVLSYVEQAKAMKDRYMSYLDTTYWKQKLEAYVMKLGDMALSAAINKIANVDRPLAYSRLIAKCKVANMKNESEVREAFIKLFLQYPTTKPAKMAEYEAIGRQFQMDSTIEAIVTGRELSH